ASPGSPPWRPSSSSKPSPAGSASPDCGLRVARLDSLPGHDPAAGGRRSVSEEFELKPISTAAVPKAIKKAEQYRLINEPEQAESICLDILAAQPGDQYTITVLILPITAQSAREGSAGVRHANEYVTRLDDEYQRYYYGGLVLERQARAYLRRGKSRVAAHDCFRDAMDHYEK